MPSKKGFTVFGDSLDGALQQLVEHGHVEEVDGEEVAVKRRPKTRADEQHLQERVPSLHALKMYLNRFQSTRALTMYQTVMKLKNLTSRCDSRSSSSSTSSYTCSGLNERHHVLCKQHNLIQNNDNNNINTSCVDTCACTHRIALKRGKVG